jgi:hypothetical protein
LKLAELMGALAEAKMGIADLRTGIEEKDAEIARLTKALANQSELRHDGSFYFKIGDSTPFCPRCWEVNSLCVHVSPEVWDSKTGYYLRECPECESRYKTRDRKGGGPLVISG